MTRLTLLGSTGSIGTSTLDVVRQWPDRFQIHALVAGRNVELLAQQIREFRPKVAVVADADVLQRLRKLLQPPLPELGYGDQARIDAASESEVGTVVSAIVGVQGLPATYAAVRLGKRIGLANKEVLVAGGALVTSAAKVSGAEIIPIDSEHNGAHQCLRAGRRSEVARLYLTASGGPFRETPASEFDSLSPEQALKHPTWQMGRRITIDSATLMNKGFEVIEACWLFDFQPNDVEVVVHPQSKIHAMVEYNDGSLIAQISVTDMRMPIQYALTWPERWSAPVARLDWSEIRRFDFYPPDFEKFPLLKLAYDAKRAGGSASATLNAADEIAVEAFLERRIPFTGIARTVGETLNRVPCREPASISDLMDIDRESRASALRYIEERYGTGYVPGEKVTTESRLGA